MPEALKEPGVVVPRFQEVTTGVTHIIHEDSYTFLGTAAIDVDNDGDQELFVGGGRNQQDRLLDFKDGKWIDITKGSGLSSDAATYGILSLDIDNDGWADLLVTREDGH